MYTTNRIHESIVNAIEAVSKPEVQDLIKQLSHHGLAASVPHMHGQNGEFLPLPRDIVSLEEDLEISFVDKNQLDEERNVPVMWRWDEELNKISVAAGCGLECIVKKVS